MQAYNPNVFRLPVAVLACALLLVGCGDDDNPTSPGGQTRQHFKTVSIQGNSYIPASLTIAVGDTVRWTNNDNVGHTVTSNSGSELNSGVLPNGGTYQHVFQTAGGFGYHCTVHPTMQAAVAVQ